MSDQPDQQSKTFDPTPRRLAKAREDGEVAKSSEVSTAATLMIAGLAIATTGQGIASAISMSTQEAFRRAPEAQHDMSSILEVGGQLLTSVCTAFLPFLFLTLVTAILAHIGQTGILIAPKALLPKLSRINLFTRLKELLSPQQAFMRVFVACLKIILVGIVVYLVVHDDIESLGGGTQTDPRYLLMLLGNSVIKVVFAAGLTLSIVAVIDFMWQKHRFIEKMKMTHDEVKRESKEEEGSPELKARRKGMYRELTINRVMDEVPKADVIVTNPTHFAVALRYEANKDLAPRVVAKGIDSMALNIRRIARRNGVPVIENRPLARTLWRKVKVGRPVPFDMYEAVAAVLAHVYRLKQRSAGVTP
jgi:flagellar biosynthetic protein FlhB